MTRALPRILCVDDEREVLDILSDFLGERGFAVRIATSAQAALAEAKRWTPRALIADLVMPRLGGLEAIDLIRRVNPGLAVILISGRADAAAAVERAGIPVAAALTKPLDLSHLLAALADAGIAAGGTSPAPPAESPPGARPTVLVVDDEPDVRHVIAEYLEIRGFAVEQARSGEEALERMHAFRPGVVLLDIALPGLSGIDTLRHIRAGSAETRVVMVSANADVDVARQSLALGAADYIPKPVDFGYLDSVLAATASAGGRR